MPVYVWVDALSPTISIVKDDHGPDQHGPCLCVMLHITFQGDDKIIMRFANMDDLRAFVSMLGITVS